MRPYRRFTTLPQMTVSVCTFMVLALLLESGGLVRWAQRLELGPERTLAIPTTTFLAHSLAWTHLDRARHAELLTLARIGWSDDPVALAEVHKSRTPAATQPTSVTHQPGTTATASAVPGTTTPATINHSTTGTPSLPLQPIAGDPPILSTLPAFPPVAAGAVRTIALAGDSMMAVGLSSTLLRQAPQYKDIAFIRAFKSGTGLARPEVFNWQTEYPAMLKAAHPDVVLVAIGANDGQGFVENDVVYPFGTDGWKDIYERRVQAYLDLLEAGGATVIWLGLPPMKSDVYNAHIALVNRIDYAVVSASPHAIWYSTAGLVGDPAGRFQDFGQVGGKITRLRQGDGIHLSDDGAVLVVEKLLPWLAAQTPPPPPPLVPVATPEPKP